jgi:hypothetical protein
MEVEAKPTGGRCPLMETVAREHRALARCRTLGAKTFASLGAFANRHRRRPSGRAPATPPGMRVRTGRFEKLRSAESR